MYARVQSGRVTQRCHNSPIWETEASECEWRHAPEAHGGFWEILKKSVSWDEICLGGRRLVFACSRRPFWRVPHVCVCRVGGRWKSHDRKIVPLSPYVEEPLNSKVIKSFVPEQRSRQVFFEFRDPMFYAMYICNERPMYISHIHVYDYGTDQRRSRSGSPRAEIPRGDCVGTFFFLLSFFVRGKVISVSEQMIKDVS